MERWKDILGYAYQVSNHGRVRSLARVVFDSVGRRRMWPTRILKPGISKGLGYQIVVLQKEKQSRTFYVHLLVAAAFLPPCPPGFEINHEDGNKANPHYKNLEWVTHSENARHSIRIGLRRVFVCKNRRTGKLERYKNARAV